MGTALHTAMRHNCIVWNACHLREWGLLELCVKYYIAAGVEICGNMKTLGRHPDNALLV